MPLHQQHDTSTSLIVRDRDLAKHLEALGLETVEDYAHWCAQHGFGTRPDKHWHQRCRERYVALQQTIQARCARQKRELRDPRKVIVAIAKNELPPSDLISPHLVLISSAFTSLDGDERDAFLQLLLHAHGCTGLLITMPVVPQFSTQPGNTFIEALSALAKCHASWLRPVESWRRTTHNTRRQFSSLARHLLAKYPVPDFLDCVWFKGPTSEATKQQDWFIQIAGGTSPRRLDLPIRLTKRMVHHFLRAPVNCTVEAALRRAQVLGFGGNTRLVEAILGSKLATDFSNDGFWGTVIRWLIANPLLDRTQVGPLVDYVRFQKYEPQEVVLAPGQTEIRPLQPNFSIEGRTPHSLLRQMREWYGDLRKESQQKTQVTWSESGIAGFDWTEGPANSADERRWTIKEILTWKDLFGEGCSMRHCVASYERSCVVGQTSIWSMGIERHDSRRKRVLTVEVAVDRRNICQVRGRSNRLPTDKEMDIVRRWAVQAGLTVDASVVSR